MRQKNFEEFIFKTDFYYCARGFRGLFEQIGCSSPVPPSYPIEPTTLPPFVTSTMENSVECKREIGDDIFSIQLSGSAQDVCNFIIIKSNSVSLKTF